MPDHQAGLTCSPSPTRSCRSSGERPSSCRGPGRSVAERKADAAARPGERERILLEQDGTGRRSAVRVNDDAPGRRGEQGEADPVKGLDLPWPGRRQGEIIHSLGASYWLLGDEKSCDAI